MIRVREVRVVGQDGTQLGIMPTQEAQRLAEEEGLDLVEVAPTERPPVCRIMDYGKYKYQKSKRLQQAKKKQKIILIVGGVLLLAVAAIQVPKLLKGSSAPAPSAEAGRSPTGALSQSRRGCPTRSSPTRSCASSGSSTPTR